MELHNPCPLWVISGHVHRKKGMSALPPKATAKADMKFPNRKFCRGGLRPLASAISGDARGRERGYGIARSAARAVTVLSDHAHRELDRFKSLILRGGFISAGCRPFPDEEWEPSGDAIF
jgi:hypothetical protein